MKTNQVFSVMAGIAFLSGAAFAQADGPQGPGPREEGAGMRPERSARMQCGRPGRERGPDMMPARQHRDMGEPQMRRDGLGPREIRDRMPDPAQLKKAGATDQQLEALRKLADEQQLKRIDLKAAAEKAELAFEQQMRGEAVDAKAALKAADALSQTRADLFRLEVSSKLKAREILGAEVLKKLHELGAREGVGQPPAGPRSECPLGKDDVPPAGGRPQPEGQK